MALNILAVADVVSPLLYDHFQRERWADIDLIISCGDLPAEYLDFLVSSLNVPLLYVHGNHDDPSQSGSYPGENLHGKMVREEDVLFAGFEGSRLYNRGAYQYSEKAMRGIVRRAGWHSSRKGRPQVILTHAPPSGIHDAEDPAHQGFEVFRSLIDKWKPRFFVHGHTHTYDRQEALTQIDGTTVINAYPYRVLRF
jgi:uncharacterized protein